MTRERLVEEIPAGRARPRRDRAAGLGAARRGGQRRVDRGPRQRHGGEPAVRRAARALAARGGRDRAARRHLAPGGDRARRAPADRAGRHRAALRQPGPACRETLEVAAVFGQAFELQPLVAALGTADEGLVIHHVDAAVEAQLVRETAGGYRFGHAMVCEALYRGLRDRRREQLHARVGEAVEAVAGVSFVERAAELAHHFRLLGCAGASAEGAGLQPGGRTARGRSLLVPRGPRALRPRLRADPSAGPCAGRHDPHRRAGGTGLGGAPARDVDLLHRHLPGHPRDVGRAAHAGAGPA